MYSTSSILQGKAFNLTVVLVRVLLNSACVVYYVYMQLGKINASRPDSISEICDCVKQLQIACGPEYL